MVTWAPLPSTLLHTFVSKINTETRPNNLFCFIWPCFCFLFFKQLSATETTLPSFRRATSSGRPEMESGTTARHAGGSTWCGVSARPNPRPVFLTVRFRSRSLTTRLCLLRRRREPRLCCPLLRLQRLRTPRRIRSTSSLNCKDIGVKRLKTLMLVLIVNINNNLGLIVLNCCRVWFDEGVLCSWSWVSVVYFRLQCMLNYLLFIFISKGMGYLCQSMSIPLRHVRILLFINHVHDKSE